MIVRGFQLLRSCRIAAENLHLAEVNAVALSEVPDPHIPCSRCVPKRIITCILHGYPRKQQLSDGYLRFLLEEIQYTRIVVRIAVRDQREVDAFDRLRLEIRDQYIFAKALVAC